MKLVNTKNLCGAVAVAAFAVIGAMPASAQSRDNTGSMMPHYYTPNGTKEWGSWTVEPAVAGPARTGAHVAIRQRSTRDIAAVRQDKLYLSASPETANH
jgi:hypothetical protein